MCNLHLRSVVRRREELAFAGVREVVVFHSTSEAIAQYLDDLPLPTVADPEKKLYRDFGVEARPRAILDPRTWLAAVRGMHAMRTLRGAVERDENHLGLPADFLIDTDGRAVARKYGNHANDQWGVDELLEIVRQAACSDADIPGSGDA